MEQDTAEQIGLDSQKYSNNYFKSPADKYGSEVIVRLTDPEGVIKQYENDLRRRVVNKKGEILYQGEQMLNDEGIYTVLAHIRAIVNKITPVSRLEDGEIKTIIIEEFCETLIVDMMINKIRYEIKDNTTRSIIVATATEVAYICAKRSTDGKEIALWLKNHQISEINTQAGQRPQSSLWDKMNIFKR